MIPKVYEMEDYLGCIEKSNVYCKVYVELQPTDINSTAWKIIQKMSNQPRYYMDRQNVIRFLCIPSDISTELETAKKYFYTVLNGGFGTLIPCITDVECLDSRKSTAMGLNSTALFMVMLYIIWVILATIYDVKMEKSSRNSEGSRWIRAFSLRTNVHCLMTVKGGDDLQVLQGFRVFTMSRIICMHVLLTSLMLYNDNTEDVEWIFLGFFKRMLLVITNYTITQPFFVISSMLLVNQIYRVYNENGIFTIWNCWVIALNRIARYLPSLVVILWIMRNSQVPYGPQTFEITKNIEKCHSNWLPLLLFYNNMYLFRELCHPPTWYLAADTQLYFGTIITMYVVLKYKVDIRRTLAYLLFISTICFAATTYYNGMGVLSLDARDLSWTNFLGSPKLLVQYTSTVSNWSSSIVGMAAGVYYYHNKGSGRVADTWANSTVWRSGFWGLITVAHVIVEVGEGASGAAAAILTALVRPVNAAGLAVGLLGMARGLGGIERRFYKWKPMVILGNIIFSVSIWHGGILPLQNISNKYGIAHLDYSKVVVIQIGTLIGSFAIGAIMNLMVEQPFLNLQKLVLPQLPNSEKDKCKEKNQ